MIRQIDIVRILPLLLVLPAMVASAGLPEEPFSRPDPGDSPYSSYWDPAVLSLLRGDFAWTIGGTLLHAQDDDGGSAVSVRQPSTVRFQGRWHMFAVTGQPGRPHRIEYLASEELDGLRSTRRTALDLGEAHASCPQVFYFEPAKRWFMVFQSFDPGRKPAVRPMFSTSPDISDPGQWSRAQPMTIPFAQFDSLWRDFWVICDEEDAYLFYTTGDGRVYRCRGPLDEFPRKWNPPLLCLKGDFISSAHIYRVGKLRRYLMLATAADLHRRYIKAYINTRLDEGWDDLCVSLTKPMAGAANVRLLTPMTAQWTDTLAEAELVRDGVDQTQTVDPKKLRMIFTGCLESERAGKAPGEIPWKIGIIEPAAAAPGGPFRD